MTQLDEIQALRGEVDAHAEALRIARQREAKTGAEIGTAENVRRYQRARRSRVVCERREQEARGRLISARYLA